MHKKDTLKITSFESTKISWMDPILSKKRKFLGKQQFHFISSSYLGINWSSYTLKFLYSEKVPKFCEIFTLLLSYVVPVKSKVKISQNFVAFSEYRTRAIISRGLYTFLPHFQRPFMYCDL